MTFSPTREQAAIVDAARTGAHLVIEAGAGTGKTSTLKLLARAKPNLAGLYLAYNKAIAADAAKSFPTTVVCRTAHSLAFAAVGKLYRARLDAPRLPARVTAQILGINEPLKLGDDVPWLAPQQIARIVMAAVERFCQSGDAWITRKHIPKIAGFELPAARAALADAIGPYARKAWEDITRIEGRLRFTHDCYLKIWSLSSPDLRSDYVLLDEAQDSNPAVASIVDAQRSAQRILVGDRCQPAGTMVTVVREYRRGNRFTGHVPTRTEQVPIEQLQTGDRVVSYNVAHRFLRRTGSLVTGITTRPVNEYLVKAETDSGLVSRYTANHHCVARFGEDLNDKTVVYMMRRGNDYRIGVTGGRIASQSKRLGLVIRANQEGADAAWILGVYDDRRDALHDEMVTAWLGGIPEVTFKAGNRSTVPQEDLNLFWRKVGGNDVAAARVLTAAGRDIRYPLWEKGGRLDTRRPFVTQACNLMSGMELLPLTGAMMADGKSVTRKRWEPIRVSKEPYNGLVYSLTVEGDHTYVGDGIVTHNCQAIYGWRGAVDAMEHFDGQRLYLSQSFRFGPEIAREANKWLRLLDAELRLTGYDKIPSRIEALPEPDAILCRSNGGAINQLINALNAGRRVALVGGGDDMRRYAEAAQQLMRHEPCAHPELVAFSSWAEVRDYVDQDSGGSDLKVIVDLIDKHGPEALIRLSTSLSTEDRADVVISTAHKAKGREWRQVKIGPDFTEPKPSPQTGIATLFADDAMLAYVAVTRAQDALDRGSLAWIDAYTGHVGRTFDALLDASSLGAPKVREAITSNAAARSAELTGMPEEQADWDADLADPADLPGCCRLHGVGHTGRHWAAPIPVGATA